MFNKLRNKYVLTNMILIGTLITVSFVAIFYTSYLNTLNSLYEKLDEQSFNVNADDFNNTNLDATLLYIMYDEFNNVIDVGGYLGYDLLNNDQFIQEISKMNHKKKFMKFDNQYFISKAYVLNGKSQSSSFEPTSFRLILDATNQRVELTNLFLVMLLILLIVLGLIFIVCVYLANKSVEQLKIAWDKQRQFIGDASHELKTPLAIIEANVDALSLLDHNQWTQNIKGETERMSVLLSELLYLTKIDDYDLDFDNKTVNLSDIVNTVLITNEVLIFENNLNLQQHIEDDIVLVGDAEKLKQLIHILVNNSIRYSDESIEVNLKKEFNTITFTIENSGVGITDENISKVFDRFYKGDVSRSSDDNSYGLGLSIAQAIVSRMGGDIYVQSVVNEKTKFTIIFQV